MERPLNLRQTPVLGNMPDAEDVALGGGDLGDLIDPSKNLITIDLPDGSVNINFGPLLGLPSEEAEEHDANLALHVPTGTLENVSSELLRLISNDKTRQDKRLQDIVKGIELLGIKIEEPRAEPGEDGISVIRHPLLLEAILRFQANARGEMLPADGPVKVTNYGDQDARTDDESNALEDDMNYYLTTGAPEYYPDTDRMFFSLGMGGEAYKKVYIHPIKRRPVSETIDRKDLILSDGAVSLETCARVTHRSEMKPSDVKRMQLAGIWRNVTLGMASPGDNNPVDIALENVSGVDPKYSIEPGETDREIYECYCELDLEGFQHEEDGAPSGLPLPYRVTIDKDSRQILEIRRWWEEGDEAYTRKEVFVEYIFVPAFPGVNLGLLHILGNASRALTAAWRIALDNGMLANFPGGIMARSTGKQQTTTIRVGPGQVAPVDVDGVPLKDAFMPLPYRDVTSGFVQIIGKIEETSQRLGGTAETAVGEGRNDAPVGTTIAMIEQATKVLNAVHKRMHQAQAKEFGLLKELFRKDPESIWRSNRNPRFMFDHVRLVNALENKDIVPKADPNCASQTLRIQKAIAIKTLAQANPQLYDQQAIDRRIMQMIGIEDADDLFNKNPPMPPGPDPILAKEAEAKMIMAQSKAAETQAKLQGSQLDQQVKLVESQARMQDAQTKMMEAEINAKNHVADRESKEKLAVIDLAQSEAVHPETAGFVDKLLNNPNLLGNPTGGEGVI